MKQTNGDKFITIRLPGELHKALKLKAVEDGVTINALLLELIRAAVGGEE